jgi:hypothetical protein
VTTSPGPGCGVVPEPSVGAVFEDLRPGLTDAVIRRSVGDTTFRRGAAYAQAGCVSLVVHHRDEVSGQVAGQGGVYRTVAGWDDDAGRWWGECSCPVGYDCKHVAALLLVAREALPGPPRTAAPATPDWERVLTPLVAPAPSTEQRGTPIGLQFEVTSSGRSPVRSKRRVPTTARPYRPSSTTSRKRRSVSRKTSGCSECTQWPAFLTFTRRVAGNSASMRSRSSGST